MEYCKLVSSRDITLPSTLFEYDSCGLYCKMTFLQNDVTLYIPGDKGKWGSPTIMHPGETVEFLGKATLFDHNAQGNIKIRILLYDRV